MATKTAYKRQTKRKHKPTSKGKQKYKQLKKTLKGPKKLHVLKVRKIWMKKNKNKLKKK